MAGEAWTTEQDAYLFERYPTTDNRELTPAFNRRFGTHRSQSSIAQRARKLGALKAEGHKHPMPRTFWDDEKRAWFASFVPGHTETEISAEHERLYGTPLTRGQIKSAKGSFGVKSGTVGGRFEKGHEPANKGKTWEELGISEDVQKRMRKTCFKKGEVRDRPDGWIKPIGYERVNKDGYIEVKVRDSAIDGIQPKVPGQFNCNYRMKHHIVYEQTHGPIPDGCNVVFANNDKSDFRPENLVAVPRSLWAVIVRRHMEYHDAESLQACMAIAKLKSSINAAKHHPRPCRKCGKEFAPRYAHQRTCDSCLGRSEV